MKKITKIVSLLAALTLLVTCFAGCGEKEAAKTTDDGELTFWVPSSGSTSRNDMMLFQEMEKRTGVKVNFIQPIKGSTGSEAFLTIIASKDRPDMMQYGWTEYNGGAQRAIDDGVIIALDDYMEEYAPNFYDYMEGEKGKENNYLWKLQGTTEKGQYYGFNVLNIGTTRGFAGLYMRADKLKAWGMEVPETIDEWEAVLKRAKEDGFEYPFCPDKNVMGFNSEGSHGFNTAFGVGKYFYLEGDKVVFAPYEDGFKDYVALMADWVKKGYIDTSFPSADNTMIQGNMTNGISFAAWGYVGSSLGKILPAARANNPEYDLVACPYPVMNKGDVAEFQMVYPEATGTSVAITTSCTDPETAISWYDYFYGEEGSTLQIFGLEGEHHTVEYDSDGTKHYRYTDLITDPEVSGFETVESALYHYMLPCNNPGLNQHPDYLFGYYPDATQKAAIETWNIGSEKAKTHKLPTLAFTEDEKRELMDIIEVTEDNFTIAIFDIMLGRESIDYYDKALKTMKDSGYDKVLEIQQAAYDRYLEKLN